MPSGVFDALLAWLSAVLLGALQLLWAMLSRFVLLSPDVTVLPHVRTVASRSVWVVDTVYVVAVLAAAILVMTGETVQIRYGIGDLAPRLVIGLVAANLALPLCHGLIGTANALTQGLTGDSIAAAGSLQMLSRTVTGALGESSGLAPQQLFLTVILVLLLVLTVSLLFTWLVRVGVLVVLCGISPVALACHGLPYTEPVARLWWRSMFAALGIVMAQAFALHATLTVFLSPQANLPALGIPLDPVGMINLFIVACLLWATVRIPSLARRYVTGGRPSPAASIVRIVVVQQIARGLIRGAGGRALGRLARR